MEQHCGNCKNESTPMNESPCREGIAHPGVNCWEAKEE